MGNAVKCFRSENPGRHAVATLARAGTKLRSSAQFHRLATVATKKVLRDVAEWG